MLPCCLWIRDSRYSDLSMCVPVCPWTADGEGDCDFHFCVTEKNNEGEGLVLKALQGVGHAAGWLGGGHTCRGRQTGGRGSERKEPGVRSVHAPGSHPPASPTSNLARHWDLCATYKPVGTFRVQTVTFVSATTRKHGSRSSSEWGSMPKCCGLRSLRLQEQTVSHSGPPPI